MRWSPNGRAISGYLFDNAGALLGHALLDPATSRVRPLNDSSDTKELAWLPDHHHVVYFLSNGTLVMQDITSLARRAVTGTLPYPPESSGAIVASPDGRTLYYGAQQMQANIWLVKRAGAVKADR
jgi:hypothetical protein